MRRILRRPKKPLDKASVRGSITAYVDELDGLIISKISRKSKSCS
jgi:hypothetical protein